VPEIERQQLESVWARGRLGLGSTESGDQEHATKNSNHHPTDREQAGADEECEKHDGEQGERELRAEERERRAGPDDPVEQPPGDASGHEAEQDRDEPGRAEILPYGRFRRPMRSAIRRLMADGSVTEVRHLPLGAARPRTDVARHYAKTPVDRRGGSNQARSRIHLSHQELRHYSETMPRPEIPAATIDRFVELVALDLSPHEAARAVKMGERSGDRYMSRPDIKARVEEARGKSPAGLLDDVRDAVEELLAATDKEGNPDWSARARGAELLMKHREQFEEYDAASAEEALPEGVYVVYPRVTA